MSDARQELAAAQAALLQSLLGAAEVPEGFAFAAIGATSLTLSRKRRRSVARAWPELARGLGTAFRETFADYAWSFPSSPQGGPLVDGWRFARRLKADGTLPPSARGELAAFELQHRVREGRAQHRRLGVKLVVLHGPRRIAVGVALPRAGARWWSVRIGV